MVPGRESLNPLEGDDALSPISLKLGHAVFLAVPEGLFLKCHLTLIMMEAICKGWFHRDRREFLSQSRSFWGCPLK